MLDGRQKDGFTYPVAIYDHNEGQAVTGGFAYYGRIAALRGKFVFGDIQRGRLFAADLAAMKKADDGIPQTVAPVEEIQLYVRDASGTRTYVTLRELVEQTMGATHDARRSAHQPQPRRRAFITSRQDGMIRMLVPDSKGPGRRPRLSIYRNARSPQSTASIVRRFARLTPRCRFARCAGPGFGRFAACREAAVRRPSQCPNSQC